MSTVVALTLGVIGALIVNYALLVYRTWERPNKARWPVTGIAVGAVIQAIATMVLIAQGPGLSVEPRDTLRLLGFLSVHGLLVMLHYRVGRGS